MCWSTLVLDSQVLHNESLYVVGQRFQQRRLQAKQVVVFESWATEANVHANLISTHNHSADANSKEFDDMTQNGHSPHAYGSYFSSNINGDNGWYSHYAHGADEHGDACPYSIRSSVDERDIVLEESVNLAGHNGNAHRPHSYTPPVYEEPGPKSPLEQNQLDGLVKDIMSAALVGPQFLEEKLLCLYKSGDLDDDLAEYLEQTVEPEDIPARGGKK
jgi:hypothetical protein